MCDYKKYIGSLTYPIAYIKMATLFLLLICSVLSISVSAQPYVKLDNTNKIKLAEHNLWFNTQPLETPPRFSQLNQLFKNADRVTTTLGKSGAFIAKINLTNINNDKNTWFVNINMNYLDLGTAYWQPNQGKPIQLEQFGYLNRDNPKITHSQTFSLSLSEQESGTLWIYVQAKVFAIPADINIYRKKAFYNKQFLINSITTISYTVMMTLALIAAFIYLRLKSLAVLACTGYIGLHGLGWFAASGSLGYLFQVQLFNPVYGGIFLFPFAIAAASQFTKLLFNCQQDHTKINKILNLMTIVSLFAGVLILFLPFIQGYLVSHIIAIAWIPLCIGIGIFMLRKKDFRAKYYLTGNFLYGLALAVYVLSHTYKLDLSLRPELIVLIALTIDCFCILLSLTEWLQIQQKELNRIYNTSRIDPLTQVGNRLAQNEMLSHLSGHYCITFIDLDNFKKINDKCGHDIGDKYLIDVATTIKKAMQGLGDVFRCGGDEFILVVSVERKEQVEPLLKQLTRLIKKTEQELQQKGWESAGLSFGMATTFETSNQSECLSLADQRMYKCKKKINSTNLH
ncbi:diguanylate cyclase [Algibacillus agarilyticus]|uniref:diguanylate cyclase n=1 Tax=Algibacillus agarilyticus TaxID=2234133 RepID=UPI000DD07AB9|nr:diguanylate cyclase [Algibacillus agarilyticus]